MNNNCNGGSGMYGGVQVMALEEIQRLWDQVFSARARNGSQPEVQARQGWSWKQKALILAALAVPLVLVLIGGTPS